MATPRLAESGSRRLPDSAIPTVFQTFSDSDSPTRLVGESATPRLGESGSHRLPDSSSRGVVDSPTRRVGESTTPRLADLGISLSLSFFL